MGFGMLVTGSPSNNLLCRACPSSQRLQATKNALCPTSSRFLRLHIFVERSLAEPPPGRYLQWEQPVLKREQPSVRWHIAVAGQMSCIVHTTALPLLNIFLMPFSDNMP